MIADLKPYEEYKESGLSWLGQVPGHWETRRLKQCAERFWSGGTPQSGSNEFYCDPPNGLPWLMISDLTRQRRITRTKKNITEKGRASRNLEILPRGTILYSMYASLGTAAILEIDATANQAIIGISPNPAVVNRNFVLYSLENLKQSLLALASSSTQANLNAEKVRSLPLLLPTLAEQAAIVRFLDWANGRLERAIRAKRKVIALLNEQKQAIIHRAVTRGLDPSVPLKPSGIPWLGDIPQHWEVRRVKQATRILRGKFSHRPRNDASLYDGQYPFIQTGVVAQSSKLITSYSQTLNEKGLAVSKLFPSGTLVMTIAANIGEVAVLTFDACFPDSIVGFVPSASADRDYLYMVFLSMKPELLREAPVNTQGNLNVERIGAMGMPFPPLGEQEQIAKCAEAETAAFDSAISRLNREIELLREYSTRLVADVVTGKLDVREAAARLPDDAAPDIAEDDTGPNLESEAAHEEPEA